MKKLTIYTDGSALGNPGPGGYAAIIIEGKKECLVSGGDPHTTNNRMEMKAVIEALQWVRAQKKHDAKIDLFSDSSLVINTLVQGWKRKRNFDLWEELGKLIDGLNVQFHWVKGHAENPYNEKCDAIAVAEAERVAWRGTPKRKPMEEKAFLCGQCKKETEGLFGWLPDSEMIRVDCPVCRAFIKFASPTMENIARAKKRLLISAKTLEKVMEKRRDTGEPVGAKTLQKVKSWTEEEARQFLVEQQYLF